jgi:hypothetical protein
MNAGTRRKSTIRSPRNNPNTELTNPQKPGDHSLYRPLYFPGDLKVFNLDDRVLLKNLLSLTLSSQAGPELELARSQRQSLESVDVA